MKYKTKLKNLELAKAWWDRQSPTYQKSTTRPGSINQRIITGNNK